MLKKNKVSNSPKQKKKVASEQSALPAKLRQKEMELRQINAALKSQIAHGKKVERDLRTERNFSEAIIESLPSMFYVVDDDLRVVKWNKNVEKISGYSVEDIQRLKGPDFFKEEHSMFVKEKSDEVFKKGKATCYATYRFKDGTCVPYLFTGVRATINKRKYQIGVGIDCAEIEDAKEALRESEERLALAADSAEAGLWALDVETDHLWLTAKFCELHGMSPDAKVDYKRLLDIIFKADRKTFSQAIEHVRNGGNDLLIEYRVKMSDGGIRWLNARGRLHYTVSGRPDRLMGVSMDITDRKLMEEQLKKHMSEVVKLKEQLEQENVYLREEAKLLFRHEEMIGESDAFKNVLLKIEQVAGTDSTVLVLGETGTGKELVAKAIHNASARRDRPLIAVNCASLPPSLLEAELFGREKGAYTGATTRMIGRFEAAHESTLFLDEIGELPLELQGKLLRAIEQGRFERLGSTRTLQVNVRIIAATNRDLGRAVRQNAFRKDLYYRLNVFPIVIPPLRERREDIPALVCAFVNQYEKKLGKQIETVSPGTMKMLTQYAWPGNVRELRNVIEHAMIVSNKKLSVSLVASPAGDDEELSVDLKDVERRHIRSVLETTGGRIAGPNGAAEILGLKRTTLISRMKALGISR